MKVLIICNPEEGTATELSLFLKAEAEKMNRRVFLINAEDDTKAPTSVDVVIIAATLQGAEFDKTITNYILNFKDELNRLPMLFMSVYNFSGDDKLQIPEEARKISITYLQSIGIRPQAIVAVGVSLELFENKFATCADFYRLKMALQQFVIKNDCMLAG